MRVCDYGPGEAKDGRFPGHPVFGAMRRKKHVYRDLGCWRAVLESSRGLEGHGEKNNTFFFLFFPSNFHHYICSYM